MKKLNQDLSFREIYLAIKENIALDFLAARKDIGFDNIEQDFPNADFSILTSLPELQSLSTVTTLLLQESVGIISMQPHDKLRLLVKVFGGRIFYSKIADGKEWRVVIVF